MVKTFYAYIISKGEFCIRKMDYSKSLLQRQNVRLELLVKNMSVAAKLQISNSTITSNSIVNLIKRSTQLYS